MLYELIVHDEFNFFAGLDLSKYLIHSSATISEAVKYADDGTLTKGSYVQQLINQFAPEVYDVLSNAGTSGGAQQAAYYTTQTLVINLLKALPVPVKYLFHTINRVLETMDSVNGDDAVSAATWIKTQFGAQRINTWFWEEVLSAIYWPSLSSTPLMNNSVIPDIKEAIAELWFNFFNIAKIEVFAGFKIMEDGHPSIKHPIWAPPPSIEQLIGYDAKEDAVKFGSAKILARVTSWDGGDLLQLNKKFSSMPILGKYFFIRAV